MTGLRPRFWELPLTDLTGEEWEALCDGCGKCCLHKAEDADTGRIYFTNICCKLLDKDQGRCTNYAERHSFVPDCVRLTPALLDEIPWLPKSCAYRLRHEERALPDWHYLISGDRESVHRAGESVRGWTVDEDDGLDWEEHLVEHEI